jgi:hypothetical protein
MTNLPHLHLCHARTTRAGVAKLKKAIPMLSVHR